MNETFEICGRQEISDFCDISQVEETGLDKFSYHDRPKSHSFSAVSLTCVLCVTVVFVFHSSVRTLTTQLLMSTKPRLQNLQLWAADTDEKRKVHESYLNPSASIYQTLSLLFQHIIIKAFILIYYVSTVLNFMILPQTLWVQLQFHCWAPVHTQTGSRMTACGCRRSCCRERTSSMDRHH